MAVKRAKRYSYRLTPDLDQVITQQAQKLGISKNAFVQMTLMKALENRAS